LPATEWTSSDAMKVIVDGTVQPDAAVPLVDDGHAHTVEITVPVATHVCDTAQSVVATTNNLPLESPANSPTSAVTANSLGAWDELDRSDEGTGQY
jgi:hypothetical protein